MYIMIEGTDEEKVQGLFTEAQYQRAMTMESLAANSSFCFQIWW